MFKPTVLWLNLASILVLGVVALIGTGADTDKEEKVSPEQRDARKEAREGIEQIAAIIADGKADDVKKKAKELADKMIKADFGEAGLEPVMALLKLRSKGGMGVGPKAGTYDPDGIEPQIMRLAKKRLTPAELNAQLKDISKMALITAAVAEVAALHKPEKKIGAKDPKDWEKWCKEMRYSSLELTAATKKAQPSADEIRNLSTKLNATCTNCHDRFRPAGAAPIAPLVGKENATIPPTTSADEKQPNLRLAVEEIALKIRDDRLTRARQLAEELGPKKTKLKSVMQLYQPLLGGGLELFGIEKCITDLADPKRELDVIETVRQGPYLARLSRQIVAITMIAEVHAPQDKEDREKWRQAADDVQHAADQLVKGTNPDDFDVNKIKVAAIKIQKACTSCHERFRKR